MFGAPPDLRCERCADNLRARYDTRLVAGRRRARPPIVTSLVAAAGVLLFFLVHVLPGDKKWVYHLLVWDEPLRAGELWRLVTTAFLHGGPRFGDGWVMGILHVGFNVWWVMDLGRGIEGRWGPLAMLGLVLGGAAIASLTEWVARGPGVGLSGVVYALAGFLFALRRVDAVAATLMNPRTANTLIAWFLFCIVLTMSGSLGVANWAHGAGAVWGWLAGLATRVSWRRVAIPLLALATAAAIAATPWLPLVRPGR
jgi:membrane associated rhomboid family serine protease